MNEHHYSESQQHRSAAFTPLQRPTTLHRVVSGRVSEVRALKRRKRRAPVLAILALCFCAAPQLPAQFPGGFGGQPPSRSRTSTQPYPNNGVGDAVISIDPETRSLIVIADEDTGKYISQVVSNLDRPRPQVLIKVVFLEITHNDSSDIGIEGSYSKNIGNGLTSGFMTNFTVFNPGGSNATVVPNSITPITQSLTGVHNFGLGTAGTSPVPPEIGR